MSEPSDRASPRPEAWRRPKGHSSATTQSVPSSLFSLLAKVASKQSDAPAIVRDDRLMTYRDLFQRSLALAAALMERTPPDTGVAVVLRADADIAIALVGCLAAGRTALILNASHPPDRIAAVLTGASPAMVLTDAAGMASLPRTASTPAMMAFLCEGTATTTPVSRPPDWPMAVFYTSGSTGQPRGFVRTERQFLGRGMRQLQELQVVPGDCLLSLTGMTSGTTAAWFITSLLAGAMFGVANPAQTGLRGLASMLGQLRPSILVTIPTLMRVVTELPDCQSLMARVRATYSVSEPVTRHDMERWRALLPGDCANMVSYGMTEANAIAGWILPRELSSYENRLPIGYPRADYAFALVDQNGNSVPDGEPGSLWVRGPMVSPGEWLNGRIVRARAFHDPYSPETLILPTNDIVRMLPDGMLSFAGRADDMVKIRGNRVEPSEVEAAIRRIEAVADVVVLVSGSGDTSSLVAYVAVTSGSPTTPERIHTNIRAALPSHMVPGEIYVLRALPRLPNGKVDRMALALGMPGQ